MRRMNARADAKRIAAITAAVAACACALASAGGCYERVVGAKGYGADRTRVQDANVSVKRDDTLLGYPKLKPQRVMGDSE